MIDAGSIAYAALATPADATSLDLQAPVSLSQILNAGNSTLVPILAEGALKIFTSLLSRFQNYQCSQNNSEM